MRPILILAICLLLASCGTIVSRQGQRVADEKLAEITPGQSSREDVFRLLGSPGVISLDQGRFWLYLSRRVETRSFFAPRETARQVTVIYFDSSGLVSEVAKLARKDGQRIAFSSAQTPDVIEGAQDWLDRILSNIGRVLPGGIGGGGFEE